MQNYQPPKNVLTIYDVIKQAGYEVYLVGGCVRDLILNIKPKDWDLTTSMPFEKIQSAFPHTVYENTFGTVGVVFDEEEDETLKLIEITPYRKEGSYDDKRRPSSITFSDSIYEDLERRDFTINAIAMNPKDFEIIDPHQGIKDLQLGVIRTVGSPDKRFNEDALRLIRAIRIAVQLNGSIEEETKKSITKNAHLLKEIAIERVKEEFIKIINTDNPKIGIELLYETGLLKHIVPELERGIGIEQNQAHSFNVFEHNLRAVQHAAEKKLDTELRLSALFHDIAKPHTREWVENKKDWSFHGHEVVGAKITRDVLRRLKFSNNEIKGISLFVRWHMFFSDTEKLTLAGVRRMIVRVGENNIWKLIQLRVCDRIATGRPKEEPYRLRKYKSMVEEALRNPITPSMLKIDGSILMKELKLQPGEKIGQILNILLARTIEDPSLNDNKKLLDMSVKLYALNDKELKELSKLSKNKIYEEDKKQIQVIKDKNFIQ